MDARQVIIEPVVSEKSYALMADGKYTFRVDDRAHKTQIARAVEEIFDVARRGRAHREGALEAEAARAAQRPHPLVEEGGRPAGARRPDRAVRGRRGGGVRSCHADPKDKANQPGAALRDLPAPRRGDGQAAAQAAHQRASRRAAGATPTAGSRRATAAAAPSAATARSTSSAARTACRRGWRRSSTTRTAPATSRWSSTRTARRATSSRRRGFGPASGRVRRAGRHPRRATRCRCARSRPARSSTTWSWCPGQGGRLGRAAGAGIQVAAKEGEMVTLRLPSSEMRMVRADCRATVGVLSNAEHQNVKLGKAGRKPPQGAPPADSRRRDEPRRPPARRRRGPPHARRPSGDALGQADARLPDAQEGQALRRDDRPRAARRGKKKR